MGNISCFPNCRDDRDRDHVHAGNPVMVLPGNQKVISQQCWSFALFSSNRVGLNFRYFTSSVTVISCLNYHEVNGSLCHFCNDFHCRQRVTMGGGRWSEACAGGDREKKRKIFLAGSVRLTVLSSRSTFIDQPFFSLPFSLSCFHVRMCHYYALIEEERLCWLTCTQR